MKALKCEKGRGSKAKMDEPEGGDIDLSGSVQWQEKAEVSIIDYCSFTGERVSAFTGKVDVVL